MLLPRPSSSSPSHFLQETFLTSLRGLCGPRKAPQLRNLAEELKKKLSAPIDSSLAELLLSELEERLSSTMQEASSVATCLSWLIRHWTAMLAFRCHEGKFVSLFLFPLFLLIPYCLFSIKWSRIPGGPEVLLRYVCQALTGNGDPAHVLKEKLEAGERQSEALFSHFVKSGDREVWQLLHQRLEEDHKKAAEQLLPLAVVALLKVSWWYHERRLEEPTKDMKAMHERLEEARRAIEGFADRVRGKMPLDKRSTTQPDALDIISLVLEGTIGLGEERLREEIIAAVNLDSVMGRCSDLSIEAMDAALPRRLLQSLQSSLRSVVEDLFTVLHKVRLSILPCS